MQIFSMSYMGKELKRGKFTFFNPEDLGVPVVLFDCLQLEQCNNL